ncbi:hypothetical protein T265_15049, partial [Opisthorchis viverrini]
MKTERFTRVPEREFTERKVRGFNPTSASRLPLSKLGHGVSPTSCFLQVARQLGTKGSLQLNDHYYHYWSTTLSNMPHLQVSKTCKPITENRLLKTLRQTTTGFALPLRAHQVGAVSVNLMIYLSPNWTVFEKFTHLQINLVFKRDSIKSLIHDIPQLNVLHAGCLTIQLARYSRYRKLTCYKSRRNLQIDLVFMRNSTESLVYDILQLNVLNTGRPMIQLARYSRYRSIYLHRKLLT